MTGSTALEEELDAERVRSLVDRFYAALRREVEKRNGRVVKFTGDGLMAAFGMPEVQEDDAIRAIETAAAMVAACAELAADIGFPSIALKVGVNTGEVVVIEDDDDVVGDAVNVAARLEGAAKAGEVLVGEGTWRLTRGVSRYESVEPLTLKGKTEPVPAYRLLGMADAAGDTLAAPFVGRERELAVLLSAFDETVQANGARLVTIIGSPGLGKTRLTRELAERLAGRAVVRETRCDPTSATFAPIAEALREANAIPEAADEAEVVAGLLARIPEDEPERERIATLAASILGAGQPGSTEETFWALRRMIETAAAHDLPRVLVLEDLHWAEPLLLDLVEHLAEWIREAPVLLVGTARPELRDIRPSLVEGGRASAVIALEGLDEDATARLAFGLLGTDQVPTELLARIPESTEGNPLFVRELVRMLVDDGVLQRTGTGWEVTVDVDAVEVPPTIQSLLAARVDRLRSNERTVVELAAVIGKEFYRGALHELAPVALRGEIDASLESLRRKELVEPAGTYWIDEPVYRFHHALIREAAYRRLLKETRADLHERIAGWLERKTEGVLGEHEELIGFHLEQAHEYGRQLGKLDGELGRRAATFLGEAAQRALDRDDLPAGAALSGRALALLHAEDTSRSTLLLVRCEALLSMGDVTAGAAAVAEFQEMADTPRLRAWAECFAGQLASFVAPERLQEIEKRVAAAASELAELGDPAGAAKAHTVHGSTLARLGRFAECENALDAALTAAREANDRRRITAVLGSAPLAALWGPNPVSRAGGRCLDLVRLSRITTGSPAVEVTSTRCQAVLEAFRGRTDAARRMLRSTRRTLEELGLQHELLETELFTGYVELVAGDAAEAEKHLQTAYDGFRFVGVDVLAAQSAALLARTHLQLGEVEEAERFAEESERLGGQDLKASIAWRAVRAEILARRGEFDDAKSLAESAVELASRTDALIDHGDACRALAAVCAAAGDAVGARSASESALALYERKGATALLEAATPSSVAPSQVPATFAAAHEHLDNECIRVLREFLRGFEARDWDRVAALHREDFSMHDRRPGLGMTYSGREAQVEVLTATAEVGTTNATLAPIATRGNRLSLVSSTWSGPTETAFGSEFLAVSEIDENGRILEIVVFGLDDFDAALAELDERYIQRLGDATYRQMFDVAAELNRASNSRDLSGVPALVTEDFTLIDHTPSGAGELGGSEDLLEYRAAMNELIVDRRQYIAAVHAIAPGRALVLMASSATTVEGTDLDFSRHLLAVFRDDRISQIEIFPIERLDDARSRFAELDHREPVQRRMENASTHALERLVELTLQQDWNAVADLIDDALVAEDRRQGLRASEGKRGYIAQGKEWSRLGVTNIDFTVHAIRGDRLSLVAIVFSGDEGPEGFAAHLLGVTEVGVDGRMTAEIVFDSSDFDAAFRELEERFARGEGSGFDVESAAAGLRALNASNWEELRRRVSNDLVVVDHRPASLGELHGPDEWIQSVTQFKELIPDLYFYVPLVHTLTESGMVIDFIARGTSTDGSPVEIALKAISLYEDGKLRRSEWFPPDRLDAALSRFHEIERESSARARAPQNRGTRIASRIVRAFEQREWAQLGAMYATDSRLDDRRSTVGGLTVGREELLRMARATAEVGADVLEITPMATRGERLALFRARFANSDAASSFEVEQLQIVELSDDGTVSLTVMFDPDDLDAAFEELESRFAAGEGAVGKDILALTHVLRCMNDRDWTGLRSGFVDDLVFVDHRPASLAESRGADRRVEEVRALLELMASYRCYVQVFHRLTASAGVGQFAISGTTEDGSDIEIAYQLVAEFQDGRMSRMEIFDLDALDAAIARFEELTQRSERQYRLENACTRVAARISQLFANRDWEGWAEVVAEDAVHEDRRSLVRDPAVGRAEIVALLKSAADIGTMSVTWDPIAIRGQRLALFRIIMRGRDLGSGAFGMEVLQIIELSEQGLCQWSVNLEEDALDAAFDELDDRFVRGEGADLEKVVRLCQHFRRGYNSRDWSGLRALLREDCVVVDHRPAALGTMGPDDYVRALRTLIDLIPDRRGFLTSFLAAVPNLAVSRYEARGRTVEGSEVGETYQMVWQLDGHRLVHCDIYPEEQLDVALERFESLAAGQARPLENACTRNWDRLNRLYDDRNWGDYGEALNENVLFEDRRKGLSNRVVGRRDFVENMKFIAQMRAAMRHELLATRGERLAMFLLNMYDPRGRPGSSEVFALHVHEVDDKGRLLSVVVFDPEDEDAAVEELDRRFVSGEARSAAEVFALCVSQAKAYNARDWDTYRSGLHDDLVFVDRRPASAGTVLGAEAHIEYLQTFIELAPTAKLQLVEVIAIAPERLLVQHRVHAPESDEQIELEMLVLYLIRDGRFVRIESFPVDERDDAVRRFEDLAAPPSVHPENACSLAIRRLCSAGVERRWDDVAAAFADDAVGIDRRRVLRGRATGRDECVAVLKINADLGADSVDVSTIATRSERLALLRLLVRGRDLGAEVEFLTVYELNDRGELCHAVTFDPDDREAAFTELDSRFAAGEGMAYRDVLAVFDRFRRAFNDRDWEGMRRVLAEDLVVSDRRQTSLGEMRGPDSWIEAIKVLTELVPTLRTDVVTYRALTSEGFVAQMLNRGSSEDGASIEFPFTAAVQVRGSVISRWSHFPAESLDAALAHFDELSRSEPIVHSSALQNEAALALRRLADRMLAKDWNGVASLYAENCRWEDHRVGLRSSTEGREAIVEHARVTSEGAVAWTQTELATRGDRLVLARGAITVGDFEVEILGLCEVDSTGLITFSASFDPDDLDSACAQLDARYMAGEAAPFAEVWASVADAMRALNSRDWEAFRKHFADDYQFTDHRPASLAPISDAAGQVDSVRTLTEVIPNVHGMTTAVLRLDERGGIFRTRLTGTGEGGGPVELAFLVLFETRNGLRTRQEFFPEDQLDAAVQRFDELRLPGDALENAATRNARQVDELVRRGDWASADALVAEDVILDDRRRGVGSTGRGRGAWVENFKAIRELGLAASTQGEFLAIRGDRLALGKGSAVDADGNELAVLFITELDDEDRAARMVWFDPDNLDAAMAELDERYLAGEGAPHASDLRVAISAVRATTERDWDALRALFRDDLLFVDHRPASPEKGRGADRRIEELKTLFELLVNSRMDVLRFHRVAEEWTLGHLVISAESLDGAAVEISYQMIAQLRDGKVARIETFPVDQLDEALTRFEELRQEPTGSMTPIENLVTRNGLIAAQAMDAGDWETARKTLADDLVSDDRRRGVASRAAGADAWMTNFRTMHDLGFRTADVAVLATRGDRVALQRGSMTDPQGNVVEGLIVSEADEQGLTRRIIWFDTDDIDAAVSELDELYLSGEAAPYADGFRVLSRLMASYNAREWETYRSGLSDDFVQVDHRPAGAGTLTGPDDHFGYVRTLLELAPDAYMLITEILAIDADRFLAHQRVTGSTPGGAEIELASLVLAVVRDGYFARFEQFSARDLDFALTRFDEFGREEPVGRGVPENAATRAGQEVQRCLEERDWQGFRAAHATNVRIEDRRPGLRWESVGVEQALARAQEYAPAGDTSRASVTIAVRGDRLALVRRTLTDSAEWHSERLLLQEVDDDGRFVFVAFFGGDDVDAAVAELDDRYAAGEGAPCAAVWETVRRTQSAYNSRDWDVLRSAYSPNLVVTDHRPAGSGAFADRESWISFVRRLLELSPDIRTDIVAVHELSPVGGVFEWQVHGTNQEGGEIDLPSHTVIEVRDGVVSRIEQFPIEQLRVALARFDELRADRSRRLENACSLSVRRLCSACVEGRWDEVAASFAEDAVGVDRRRGLRGRATGRSEIVAMLKINADLGADTVDVSTVATRGERLALLRLLVGGRDLGLETEFLTVYELNDEGELCHAVTFDPDDHDAAFAELDERYLAGEAAHAAVWRVLVAGLDSFNTRDWKRFRAMGTRDYVLTDHRPASFGVIQDVAKLNFPLVEIAPDVRCRATMIHAIDERGTVVRVTDSGTTNDGVAFESAYVIVSLIKEGQFVRHEVFPEHELDAALERFESRAQDDSADDRGPANQATRIIERWVDRFQAGDWTAVEALHAADCRYGDRRLGLRSEFVGRDSVLDQIRAISSLASDMAVDYSTLATRGERLALSRGCYRGLHPKAIFEVVFLTVLELDDQGLIKYWDAFDEDDLDVAFAELDRRFLSSDEATGVHRIGHQLLSAYNQRDWARFSALVADDFVATDHRPVGRGAIGAADHVASSKGLIDLVPDLRSMIVAVHRQTQSVALARQLSTGTDSEGNAIEYEALIVLRITGSLISSIDLFSVDAFDRAIAKFEELASGN